MSFLWCLLSKPTHGIRVRIAEAVVVGASVSGCGRRRVEAGNDDDLSPSDKALLDNAGEALARLGRVKRVGLGVQDKVGFVRLWTRTRRIW